MAHTITAYRVFIVSPGLEPRAFRHAISSYNEMNAISREGHVLFRWLGNSRPGELAQAEKMHRIALSLCRPGSDGLGTAAAYGNLAHVYLLRNEWEQAELAKRKAIELTEEKHNEEGLAITPKNQELRRRRKRIRQGGAGTEPLA